MKAAGAQYDVAGSGRRENHAAQNRAVMADRGAEDEDMPDGVLEGQPLPQVEDHARRIEQAAGDNPTPLSKNLEGYAPFGFPDVTGKGQSKDFLGGIDVMIGMSKTAKNPDAACKVLTDWIGGAGAQALVNTFNDLPAFVGLKPEKFGSVNQEATWKLFTEHWLPAVKYARQLASPEVKQGLEDALAAVASGDKTPEEGTAIVQKAFDNRKKG